MKFPYLDVCIDVFFFIFMEGGREGGREGERELNNIWAAHEIMVLIPYMLIYAEANLYRDNTGYLYVFYTPKVYSINLLKSSY